MGIFSLFRFDVGFNPWINYYRIKAQRNLSRIPTFPSVLAAGAATGFCGALGELGEGVL